MSQTIEDEELSVWENEQMQEFFNILRKIEEIFCPRTYSDRNEPYEPRVMSNEELKEYNEMINREQASNGSKTDLSGTPRSNSDIIKEDMRRFLNMAKGRSQVSNLNSFSDDADATVYELPDTYGDCNDTADNNCTDIEEYSKRLYPEQLKAFEACLKPGNVFITGRAGTGKSRIINTYIDYANKKNIKIALCAPTGIAALNINGVTLHRLFRAPFSVITNEKPSLKAVDTLVGIDVLIIDEISMCRMDLFNYVCKTIIKANENKKKPIKIIVVGDFLQLPPVATPADKKAL